MQFLYALAFERIQDVRCLPANGKSFVDGFLVRRDVVFFGWLCRLPFQIPPATRGAQAHSESFPAVLPVCHGHFGLGYGDILVNRHIQRRVDDVHRADHLGSTTNADASH